MVPRESHDPTRVLLVTFLVAGVVLAAMGIIGTRILLRPSPRPVVVVAPLPVAPPAPPPAVAAPIAPVTAPVRSRRRVVERRPAAREPSLRERTDGCKDDPLCGLDLDSQR